MFCTLCLFGHVCGMYLYTDDEYISCIIAVAVLYVYVSMGFCAFLLPFMFNYRIYYLIYICIVSIDNVSLSFCLFFIRRLFYSLSHVFFVVSFVSSMAHYCHCRRCCCVYLFVFVFGIHFFLYILLDGWFLWCHSQGTYNIIYIK